MLCRLSDLRDKEVVNINNGSCMGCVSDVELDTCSARVTAIVCWAGMRIPLSAGARSSASGRTPFW